MSDFNGFWWLVVLLGPLLVLQRLLHREIQAVFLLITRRGEISLALFSLLFFPGVLLHEGSHYLMARLLGVRTGRFSLLPRQMKDGRLQLGFVETSRTDLVRDALIGSAPLMAGGVFVAYAGLVQMELPVIWESLVSGDVAVWLDELARIDTRPDFWLWFYLTFTISSTMLPSRSDRGAWLPLAIIVGFFIVVGVLLGAGPWLLLRFGPFMNQVLESVSVVLAITVALHIVLLFPFRLLRSLLSRLTGLQVV